MKVLHVVPSFHPAHIYGGPIVSIYALCRHLSRLGCEVRVLTTDANGPAAVLPGVTGRESRLDDGVRIRYCRRLMPESYSPELLFRLAEHLRWADVVHLTAVYSFPTIPTLLAARLLGKPVLWSPRGAMQPWDGQRRQQLKKLWRAACNVVRPRDIVVHATSEEERIDTLRRFPGINVAVVPNGVECPYTTRRVPGSGTLRLLYIGRLHPKKGIGNLIDACTRIHNLDWTLTIAGAGDAAFEEILRGRIAGDSRIRMTGQIIDADREAAFANADVLVCPSFGENFGMVIAEALARAVPVIASRHCPWPRLEDEGCGLWVDNDPETLANAIRQIAHMPIGQMGARGRAWMLREFDWQSRARQMQRAYQSAINRTGSASGALPTLNPESDLR